MGVKKDEVEDHKQMKRKKGEQREEDKIRERRCSRKEGRGEVKASKETGRGAGK